MCSKKAPNYFVILVGARGASAFHWFMFAFWNLFGMCCSHCKTCKHCKDCKAFSTRLKRKMTKQQKAKVARRRARLAEAARKRGDEPACYYKTWI